MSKLSEIAYVLAEEIRDGQWKHVTKNKPAPDCEEIINELKKRCPNYTVEEYKRALSTGLFESR